MIYQDGRRTAMQAYTKHKTYYDKNANARKFKEAEYLYLLQPKTDHQESKIPFTEFRWFGPYINEEMLLNKNYLVSKNGTNKTQVPRFMWMRQLTPGQTIADIGIPPQEWTLDPETSLKHDDFFAGAWGCEYETPTFHAEKNNATPPNSPEISVKSDLTAQELWNTPGTTQKCSREVFPQT